MSRVLFVCTDNAVRSLIAEACLRSIAGGSFAAYSAGIDPAGVHPLTRVALTEAGIGTRELHSEQLEQYLGQQWDYVISLCDQAARHPMLTLVAGNARRLHWEVPDPASVPGFTARLRAFRASRDAINRRVEGFVASVGPVRGRDCLVVGAPRS